LTTYLRYRRRAVFDKYSTHLGQKGQRSEKGRYERGNCGKRQIVGGRRARRNGETGTTWALSQRLKGPVSRVRLPSPNQPATRRSHRPCPNQKERMGPRDVNKMFCRVRRRRRCSGPALFSKSSASDLTGDAAVPRLQRSGLGRETSIVLASTVSLGRDVQQDLFQRPIGFPPLGTPPGPTRQLQKQHLNI
jgi:hypothetical protein